MVETNSPPIEPFLRHSAPALPPGLKNRTLARAAQVRARRQQRRQRAMMGVAAAVLMLQMLTLSRLDAQNAALIAGNGPTPTFAPISFTQIVDLLRERSREIALLTEPSKIG